MLSFASKAYVFFPGGFCTLDEFFEMVTLIQTKKLDKPVPIVVIGKEFWQPMFDWIEQEVYGKQKAIEKEDLEIFHLVDTIEEVFEIIKKC